MLLIGSVVTGSVTFILMQLAFEAAADGTVAVVRDSWFCPVRRLVGQRRGIFVGLIGTIVRLVQQ